MRETLCGLAVFLLLTATCFAQPANLDCGVYIAHHPIGMAFSSDPPPEGWCQDYLDNHAITDPAEQNPQVYEIGPAIWYVLAFWYEPKDWCSCEFGLGRYTGEVFGFSDWGACFPGTGLEVPTAGWPGPEQGVALIAGDVPWQGTIIPVYYFAGYVYEQDEIPLAVHPGTGFGGFRNCDDPPQRWDAVCLGSMGLFTDGVYCEPIPCHTHVCCLDGECTLLEFEYECEFLEGEWHPEWESCEPNPCPPLYAVCCIEWECLIAREEDCDEMGGIWYPDWGVQCWPEDICASTPSWAACCLPDGGCELIGFEECYNLGGLWLSHTFVCDPSPCRGSCCLPDLTCVGMTESDCLAMGGQWYVDLWGACDPDPCVDGTCCLPDGGCRIVPEDECLMVGGTWWAYNYGCDPNPCPPASEEAVCCHYDLTCEILTESECEDIYGQWHPEWDSCDPSPCVDGLCCLYGDVPGYGCALIPEEPCLNLAGWWAPINPGTCDPNPCPTGPPYAVCCLPSGECELLDLDACWNLGGVWHPEFGNIPCDPVLCQPAGVDAAEDVADVPPLAVAPNPFTGETVIRYLLENPADVHLAIYDASGRLVRRLLAGAAPAGAGSVGWAGRNAAGSRVAPGTYFCRLSTDGEVITRQVIVLE